MGSDEKMLTELTELMTETGIFTCLMKNIVNKRM